MEQNERTIKAGRYSYAAIREELDDSICHPDFKSGFVRTHTMRLRDSLDDAARIAGLDNVISDSFDEDREALITIAGQADGDIAISMAGRRHFLTCEIPFQGDPGFRCALRPSVALLAVSLLDNLARDGFAEVVIAANGERITIASDRRRTEWLDLPQVTLSDYPDAFAQIDAIQAAPVACPSVFSTGLVTMLDTRYPTAVRMLTTELGVSFQLQKPVRDVDGDYFEYGRWVRGGALNESEVEEEGEEA
ncbi:hypothetical protein HWD35_10485 [Tsukamurella tyrosinosolvens]|uniref:hypothetical protein n=1 Tax=Tsukamurella tyrosinosolvens TaxID=57704 RepID=UPI001CE184FD|nr:hypothetical protein [Tsukamurella tyrosinosolvens]MCA4995139.1 hypothetical protein [Tsukamurella tyrosinosolvens]